MTERVSLTEAEYIILTYAEVAGDKTLRRREHWKEDILEATVQRLIARAFLQRVPTVVGQSIWETSPSGEPESIVVTAAGLAAYDTQDHNSWAMEETGVLMKRRPDSRP